MNNLGENSVSARLAVDRETARHLSDALAARLVGEDTAVAAYEERSGWVVEIHFRHPPDEAAMRALIDELAGAEAGRNLAFATVAARDWVSASLEGLPPVAAGRFVVHGAHDRSRVAPNRIGIEIEAALAFGTGHHATTRGCLLALDRIAKSIAKSSAGPRNRYAARSRRTGPIFDVGTGSGVLAIATARIMHCPVLAGDIDPVSVRAARDNARLNVVGALVTVILANGVSDRRWRTGGPCALAFANILLTPLKRLAGPLAGLSAHGTRLVLSGLLAGEANAALAAYRPHGFVLQRRILLDGWATLVLVRNARGRP
jgi:ribosomal protein L11 methyltransferase